MVMEVVSPDAVIAARIPTRAVSLRNIRPAVGALTVLRVVTPAASVVGLAKLPAVRTAMDAPAARTTWCLRGWHPVVVPAVLKGKRFTTDRPIRRCHPAPHVRRVSRIK